MPSEEERLHFQHWENSWTQAAKITGKQAEEALEEAALWADAGRPLLALVALQGAKGKEMKRLRAVLVQEAYAQGYPWTAIAWALLGVAQAQDLEAQRAGPQRAQETRRSLSFSPVSYHLPATKLLNAARRGSRTSAVRSVPLAPHVPRAATTKDTGAEGQGR